LWNPYRNLIEELMPNAQVVADRFHVMKQAFASTFIEIAQSIPDSATLEFINSVKKAVPNLTAFYSSFGFSKKYFWRKPSQLCD
jgi:transposase